MTNVKTKVYKAGPTAAKFHSDKDSKVKALMSSVGSGKSTACVIEMFLTACQQEPDADGIRHTRFACIRATYAQLKSTCIKTVLDWIPEKKTGAGARHGMMKMVMDAPIRGHLELDLPDGTHVSSLWYFMPVENEHQLESLLSLELTGAWINESSEIKLPSLVADVFERCRRFPSEWTRGQVLMDYNPPPIGSWLYDHFETNPIPGHTLWKYPSPVLIIRDANDPDDASKYKFLPNPDGQNDGPAFHKEGIQYWLDSAENRRYDESKLVRFITGSYPLSNNGRPIHPAFNERRHVKTGLMPTRSVPLVLGLDAGLTPAFAAGQLINNRLCVFDEVMTDDCTALQLIAKHIVPMIRNKYVGYTVIVCCDPAATQRSQVDAATVFGALSDAGLSPVIPALKNNNFTTRIEALDSFLMRDGGFALSDDCSELKTALAGGYCWQEINNAPHAKIKADKTSLHSDLGDAIQYLACYYALGGDMNLQDSYNPFMESGFFDEDSVVADYQYPGAATFMYV